MKKEETRARSQPVTAQTSLANAGSEPSAAWWTAETRHTHGRMLHIDLDKAVSPRTGECIVDSWWSVHPAKGVAFYYQPFGYARSEDPSPQCNQSEATASALTARGHPEHEVRKLPCVFMGHAREAMNKDREALKAADSQDGTTERPTEPRETDQ